MSMNSKTGKPKIAIALEPGDYIVSVHQGFRRAWKHQGNGLFVGHGGKIKRPTIADGIQELTSAAEGAREEKWGTCPSCGSPKFKHDHEVRFVSPLIPDCNTIEVISRCFSCGHDVSRIEG